MTIVASPDQIFRSTATNSTCRVATTLLGFHNPPERGCGALGGSPAQGRGDGSCSLYKGPLLPTPHRLGRCPGGGPQAERRERSVQRPSRSHGGRPGGGG